MSELVELPKDLRKQIVGFAREDPVSFLSYVMRDDKTGKPFKLAPMHEAWHYEIDHNDRVLVWAHIEAGKSSSLSVGRSLYEIGRDQTKRIAVVSNTSAQAEKITGSVARNIESNPELHEVFPDLKPGSLWTKGQLRVANAPFSQKDPSFQAFGVHGAVTGARLDFLILDDILDYENCRTEHQREELWNWLLSAVFGRLTENAKVVAVGTAYHPRDALHRFAKLPGTRYLRYPAVDEDGNSQWPEKWSKARIEKKREELGPIEFARQMMCTARDDKDSRFKMEWIQRAIDRGKEYGYVHALRSIPPGCKTYTGVDLAVSKKDTADSTALFTALIHPDGTREVLDVDIGRYTGIEIIRKIIDVHHRYGSIIFVESNAAQMYITQFTRELSSVPVLPFQTTAKNKFSPEFGVESVAVEFASGKWIIPSGEGVPKAVQRWIDDMVNYSPDGHTPDSLMALWIMREGMRSQANVGVVEFGTLNLRNR